MGRIPPKAALKQLDCPPFGTAHQDVTASHIPPSPSRKFRVMGQQDRVQIGRVHRQVVVTGSRQAGFTRSPSFVPFAPEPCPDRGVYVLVEDEPHWLTHHLPLHCLNIGLGEVGIGRRDVFD